MLPVRFVDHAPVGIKVICPPVSVNKAGGVIVLMSCVPLTKEMGFVGAIVFELGIVCAGTLVANNLYTA